MTKISKTIIFFGTDEFSAVSLQSLIKSGYNIVAVVTKPDNKSGRGQKIVTSAVKKIANQNNITVWQPIKVSDINADIIKLGNEITGVLVSYGKIIPKSTIALFTPGIINVHPSLLPKYRGPSPIESAIENGDSQTGVSIMKLSSEMDAGPVYGYTVYKLSDQETRLSLREVLAEAGSITLTSLLPGIIEGSIQANPQNETDATYCKLLKKDNALLKPNDITAIMAERFVRAHLGFPKTKIDICDHLVVITKAHVSNKQISPLDIECKDNKYLSVDELIAPSGRTLSARDFLNGYKLS